MNQLYLFYKEHQVKHNLEVLDREQFVKRIEDCSDDEYEKFTNSLRDTNFNINENKFFNINQ